MIAHDVGLKPEQVSIYLDPFERRHEIKVMPPCSGQDDYFPAHLTFRGDHISLSIMQVAGYNEFFCGFQEYHN